MKAQTAREDWENCDVSWVSNPVRFELWEFRGLESRHPYIIRYVGDPRFYITPRQAGDAAPPDLGPYETLEEAKKVFEIIYGLNGFPEGFMWWSGPITETSRMSTTTRLGT